jgi:hypothetical protein
MRLSIHLPFSKEKNMAFATEKYRVRVEFTEDILGTAPADDEVYDTYIGNKIRAENPAAADEELETLPDVPNKAKTTFHRDQDGTPFLYNYVVKGYFKDVCGVLRRTPGTLSNKIRAYKKIVDGMIFPYPRRVHLTVNGEMYELQRPLRGETPQGPRVALACSDTIPAGSTMEFDLEVLANSEVTEDLLREWLSYGHYRGFGQWRNAGWGSFDYELEKLDA